MRGARAEAECGTSRSSGFEDSSRKYSGYGSIVLAKLACRWFDRDALKLPSAMNQPADEIGLAGVGSVSHGHRSSQLRNASDGCRSRELRPVELAEKADRTLWLRCLPR